MSGVRRPLRIIEIETFGRGGLIHYAYNLSRALGERGHEVTLVTHAAYELDGHPLPSTVRVEKAFGRVTHRSGGAGPSRAAAVLTKLEAVHDAWKAAAFVRRVRPDLVHLHCTTPIALVHVTLLRRLGVPVAVTAHVVTPHERSRLGDAVARRVYHRADLVVAHSGFDRGRLLTECAIDASRLAVIPHGEYGFFTRDAGPIDREAARAGLGLGPQHDVALFFGFIREYKGLDALFEAWPAVARARPGARLLVAGDPARMERHRRLQLEKLAARLGVVHRFGYVPVSDVSRYFAAADVLVMPYRHVSQSGVLFLALSLGLPVVATRVGGLPETLRDGESGLLVAPDAPGELADALIRILGDPGLRERLASGGRQVAAAHGWDVIAERTEAAFRDIV